MSILSNLYYFHSNKPFPSFLLKLGLSDVPNVWTFSLLAELTTSAILATLKTERVFTNREDPNLPMFLYFTLWGFKGFCLVLCTILRFFDCLELLLQKKDINALKCFLLYFMKVVTPLATFQQRMN